MTPCLFDSRGSSESCIKSMSVAVVRQIKIGQIVASTSLHNQEARMDLDMRANTTVLR